MFGPDDMEIFGTGWSIIEEGLLASNRNYEYERLNQGSNTGFFGSTFKSTMCHDRSCTVKEGLDGDGYCHLHAKKVNTALTVVKANGGTYYPPSTSASPVNGVVAESPFSVATRLFKEGKLSKKAWKRARRASEAQKPIYNRAGLPPC